MTEEDCERMLRLAFTMRGNDGEQIAKSDALYRETAKTLRAVERELAELRAAIKASGYRAVKYDDELRIIPR